MATTERFTYAQAFPGDWLHSPELGDKPWTVRIVKAERQELKNHKTGKVDVCVVFTFANPKTGELLDHKYIASKTNVFICSQAFGQWNTDWQGHLITIASVPCDFGPWGSRVSFIGSPDVKGDMKMTAPGDRPFTFKKTNAGKTQPPSPQADPDPEPEPDADPDATPFDDLEADSEANANLQVEPDPDDGSDSEADDIEMPDWAASDPRRASEDGAAPETLL
jgi:hypothetical protein